MCRFPDDWFIVDHSANLLPPGNGAAISRRSTYLVSQEFSRLLLGLVEPQSERRQSGLQIG